VDVEEVDVDDGAGAALAAGIGATSTPWLGSEEL
jgi:hypothetical protein